MITIKTAEDIAHLEEGGRRLATIINDASKLLRPGLSTDELNTFVEARIASQNGDRPAFLGYRPSGADRPFPAALCVCINDEIVHGIPNEQPAVLQDGDVVTLDAGLVHKDLFTDHAVTYIIGTAPKEIRDLLQVTKDALWAGIMQAIPGNKVGDISAAIEKHVTDNGFTLIEGLAGHGVGYGVHEPPYVPNQGKKGTGELLRPGMVLAIEPMCSTGSGDIVLADDKWTYKTADGSISAQFEHTVVITEGEPLVVTNLE